MEDDELVRAFDVIDNALDAADAMPGTPAKTERIRNLATRTQGLYDKATEIRGREMDRVYQERALSLGSLALELGVSKQLAATRVRRLKQRQDKEH